MIVLPIIIWLYLALVPAFAASPEFTTPVIADQPVVIVQIQSDEKNADTVITVENRSSKNVKDVWLVLAGHNCNIKPVWPLSHYCNDEGKEANNDRPIGPGARIQIKFTEEIVRNVALSAEQTCGKKLHSELAVTKIDFSDGSTWTRGDAIRRGKRAIE